VLHIIYVAPTSRFYGIRYLPALTNSTASDTCLPSPILWYPLLIKQNMAPFNPANYPSPTKDVPFIRSTRGPDIYLGFYPLDYEQLLQV
jgi:hypothetical protein